MRVFDAHFHIIDDRFPLISNDGFIPGCFHCDDYKKFQHALLQDHQCELLGGAVVSVSFQGYDKSYLLDTLQKLGGHYVGVLQVDLCASVSDADLYDLHAKGIRAVRFNFQRGVVSSHDKDIDLQYATLEAFIHRIYQVVGWHAEFYIRSSSLINSSSSLFRLLATAPKVVIDHLGMEVNGGEEGELGFGLLLELLRTGKNVNVKASGFGRTLVDKEMLMSRLQALVAVRPEGLVFGTDVPGTRARVPFEPGDIDVLVGAVGEERARLVLFENGRKLYHMDGELLQ